MKELQKAVPLHTSSRRSITGRLVASALLLAVAAAIFLYRQPIVDQLSYRNYAPSPEVSAIAERTQLTDTGRFYFYVSHPKVQDSTAFNQSCTTMRGETTAVLGCYASQQIFLFNVTDPKLDGVKEVTAAHEMLHAAYDRLSASERGRVEALLKAEASKITDPSFVNLMKEYAKSEPGEEVNELHSLVGTQIASIGPELETYYARYFKNRAVLVALYTTYQSVFADVQKQQEQLVADMDRLAATINRASSEYNAGVTSLNTDIQAFNRRAESGGFSTQTQFNAERAVLMARQKQLADDRTLIDGYIATYNTKKQLLVMTNSRAEELNHSINSQLTPLPSI